MRLNAVLLSTVDSLVETHMPRFDWNWEQSEITKCFSLLKSIKNVHVSYVSGYKPSLNSLALKETFSLSALLLGTCRGTEMPVV